MKPKDLLDRIDQLDQDATAGPWLQVKDHRLLTMSSDELLEDAHGLPAFTVEAADAEFIAEARTLLPQLGAALKAVLSKCASMERGVGYRVPGHHDTWDTYHEGMSDMAGYIEETITTALEATMSDDYTRFEVVHAAYQAWNQGFSDAQSLAIQMDRIGADRMNEDRRQWLRDHPGKAWLYENPHAEEYKRLTADIDARHTGDHDE